MSMPEKGSDFSSDKTLFRRLHNPCSFAHHRWEPVNIFVCVRKFSKHHDKKKQASINNFVSAQRDPTDEQLSTTINVHSDVHQPLLLQQARARTGLTQKQLAHIIDLHWTIIRDAELGKENVESGHIEKIRRALNVSL